MSEKPNISFGDGANIGTFQTGENAKSVAGDEVAGDKVGNQVNAEQVHGDVNQTSVGGDYNEACKEVASKLLGEGGLADVFGEYQPESPPAVEYGEADDNGRIAIETEYHPVGLLGEINTMADSEQPPTESEARSLRDRLAYMFEKAGEAGAKVVVNVGPLAVAGMKATASMTPPWNIVCPVVEAAVKLWSKKDEPDYGGYGYGRSYDRYGN